MCKNCDNGDYPIGAVWWRTSTKGQTELSPATQIKEAKVMLEDQGYVVPDERVIGADWTSLAILDCPKMETLLSWIRHGEIHAIEMYHGDRLAGNPGQKMFIIDLCERYDAKLLAKYSPIIEGKEGELLEYVRTWGKEQQVIRAQQSAKDGLRDRALVKGLPTSSQPPFGYDYLTLQNGRDHTRLIPNKDWPVVRHIWRLALGGMSMRRIVRDLHQKGVPTARGKPLWAVQVIHQILHNPVYGGRYHALRKRKTTPKQRRADTYGKTSSEMRPVDEWVYLTKVVIERPVVSWDEYLAIQDRLDANKRYSRRNAKRQYLLRGLITCEEHNRTYFGRPRSGKSGHGYVCPIANTVDASIKKCKRKWMGGPTLEREVWDRVVTLLTSPDAILGEIKRQRQTKEQTEASISEALERTNQRIAAREQAEMELVSLRIRGGLSDSIYQRQRSLLKAEKGWLDEESERLRRQLEQVRHRFVTLEQLYALQQRMGSKLNKANLESKRFVLEALETAVVVAPDGNVRVSFSIPPTESAIVSATPGRV